MKNNCAECRNGEHEDYDDNIKLVVCIDPDGQEPPYRAKLCQAHREVRLDDGYDVRIK